MDDGNPLISGRHCIMRVAGMMSQFDCYRWFVQI
jgi:hypothetical protein